MADGGRHTQGAMRAVTPDQYNRERNLMNQAPHNEPRKDDFPGFNNPLNVNPNESVTDSFFDLDKNRSSAPGARNPGTANPYSLAPPGDSSLQVESADLAEHRPSRQWTQLQESLRQDHQTTRGVYHARPSEKLDGPRKQVQTLV